MVVTSISFKRLVQFAVRELLFKSWIQDNIGKTHLRRVAFKATQKRRTKGALKLQQPFGDK